MHLPRPVVTVFSGATYRVALNRRLPVGVQRRLADAGTASLRMPAGTHVERVQLGGRPAQRYSVGASERPRVVLYLHGGGYVVGSPYAYRALAGHLALSAGAVVYSLDYRLAPEHRYPAALDDATAAARALIDVHGVAPENFAIAGDSAGGALAVATARRLVDAGVRPGALVLFSPWTDPSDHEQRARDFVVSRAWGLECAAMYRGETDPRDPGYAPMHADLGDLPPTLIHVGREELLHDQIVTFAERARDAGVDVRLVELADLWHSGHMLAGTLRAATDAVSGAGAFLRTRLDSLASLGLAP